MTKYFFILFIGFTALGASLMESEIIKWTTPLDHDFGTLEQGKPATYYFEFKNISPDPILIDNVRTSCGCTAPDWTYEPIESDSTTQIRIIFDAAKTGYFRKKIMVFVSGQRKAEKLYIEGTVE